MAAQVATVTKGGQFESDTCDSLRRRLDPITTQIEALLDMDSHMEDLVDELRELAERVQLSATQLEALETEGCRPEGVGRSCG